MYFFLQYLQALYLKRNPFGLRPFSLLLKQSWLIDCMIYETNAALLLLGLELLRNNVMARGSWLTALYMRYGTAVLQKKFGFIQRQEMN